MIPGRRLALEPGPIIGRELGAQGGTTADAGEQEAAELAGQLFREQTQISATLGNVDGQGQRGRRRATSEVLEQLLNEPSVDETEHVTQRFEIDLPGGERGRLIEQADRVAETTTRHPSQSLGRGRLQRQPLLDGDL